jgi:hypothetical protein
MVRPSFSSTVVAANFSITPFLFWLPRPFGCTVGCTCLGFWKTGGTSKNWLNKSLTTKPTYQDTCCPRSSCHTLDRASTDWLVQYLTCSPSRSTCTSVYPRSFPRNLLLLQTRFSPHSIPILLCLFLFPSPRPLHPHSLSPVCYNTTTATKKKHHDCVWSSRYSTKKIDLPNIDISAPLYKLLVTHPERPPALWSIAKGPNNACTLVSSASPISHSPRLNSKSPRIYLRKRHFLSPSPPQNPQTLARWLASSPRSIYLSCQPSI